jgi:hypothetical protein
LAVSDERSSARAGDGVRGHHDQVATVLVRRAHDRVDRALAGEADGGVRDAVRLGVRRGLCHQRIGVGTGLLLGIARHRDEVRAFHAVRAVGGAQRLVAGQHVAEGHPGREGLGQPHGGGDVAHRQLGAVERHEKMRVHGRLRSGVAPGGAR